MHILVAIISLIAIAAAWYWRLKVLREAGSEVLDAAGRAKGALSRRRFRRQAEESALATVEDPASAAAIFLFSLASENDLPADETIRKSLEPVIGEDKLEETLAYSKWAARDVVDSTDCIRRFKGIWNEALTLEERRQLVEMAWNVAGPIPKARQKFAIDNLKSALSLAF